MDKREHDLVIRDQEGTWIKDVELAYQYHLRRHIPVDDGDPSERGKIAALEV